MAIKKREPETREISENRERSKDFSLISRVSSSLFLVLLYLCCHTACGMNPPLDFASDPDHHVRSKDHDTAQQLLDEAKKYPNIGARMKIISGRLLGSPYIISPLKGSFREPEEFVSRVDGFDCMTYVETVLALSEANTVDQFLDRLRENRYINGEISYKNRLHYVIDWHHANVSRGILQDLTQGADTIEFTKTLTQLKGFQPRQTTLRIFPRAMIGSVREWLRDGDLIYFVPFHNGLDAYHLGIIFREGDRILIRHASRRKRKVVEQDLAVFFKSSQMKGFIVARPIG